MTTLTDTQVITASGGLVELGFASKSTSQTITNSATAATVLGPVTFVSDGSPCLLDLYVPRVDNSGSIDFYFLVEIDGAPPAGISQGRIWNWTPTSALNLPCSAQLRFTPSAGSHTATIKAYAIGGNATVTCASSNWTPAFLRVSKIVQATQWPAVTTGTIICTSSTRPSAPFPGQKIYETDTKKELTYDGTSWTQPWNQPWGVIGIGTHDTGATVTANTSFCSVTFTPVLNRYYQAFYTQRTIWGTAGTIGIFDSVANGRIAEQYGSPDPVTLQRTKTFSSTASRTLSIRSDGVQTPISGPYSGNERPAQLVVMDVGPA